jgi:hypothetical protein
MSETFRLACPETKQTIWIGQGSYDPQVGMKTLYAGDPEVIARLIRFLNATRGRPLFFLSLNDEERLDSADWQEFEEE